VGPDPTPELALTTVLKRQPQAEQPARTPARVALTAALTLALVAGSFAVAMSVSDVITSKISGASVTKVATGSDLAARKKLAIKAKVLQGPLVPGVRRPLKVTMANPFSQRVKVTSVTVKVGKPAAAGCQRSWVTTKNFQASKKKKPIVIAPHRRATVLLAVTLKNLPTVNQDVCKSTRIPLKVRAVARQA
jgi:hypothetical protein